MKEIFSTTILVLKSLLLFPLQWSICLAIKPVVPVRAVEHLISRSYGPSMARFASILVQKVAINQMLNLLHISGGKGCR